MYLVTGATGYLGTALVALLVQQGRPVRAVVRSPEKALLLPDAVERVMADLADEDSLLRAMAGCEGVFHLAASVALTPGETREANVGGTRRVLRAAVRAGVRRLVHTSSSAAIIDATGLVSERAAGGTALPDAYSQSKSEAEALVLAVAAEGFDARVVNVVAAYGPSPAGPASYNVALLAGIRGEVAALVDAHIAWVLAEDAAAGHLLAYDRGESGRRYVLSGEVAGFPAVLNRAAELWGSPHRVRALPPGSNVPADAPFFAQRTAVYGAIGKVRVDDANARALGFTGRGLEEGLALTVAWLKEFERGAPTKAP
ncbi:MAG: NAD-dependent epimerase/dehydratase family protein [Dehalococcoidia bacterium]